MKIKSPRLRRILRVLLILVLVILVGLYAVLPVTMGFISTRPGNTGVGEPPDGFQEVTLETEDGIALAGWAAPPENGAAILLLHGAGSSRESIRPYAALLAEHGFGVLAFDLRGHGESSGGTNRYGWTGTRDVGAAVSFLQQQAGVHSIGGLGLSLGGEILLGAASEYPALAAIASEGATHRSFEEYIDLPLNGPFYRHYTARVLYLSVQLFSGENPPTTILDSISGADSTRLLLMAAGTSSDEIAFNELFAGAAGGRADLWIIPGAGHTQGFDLLPDDYAARVIGFFEETLLERL